MREMSREYKRLKPEEIKRIQRMSAKGMTNTEIMRQTGRARSTILKAIRGELVPANKKIRYALHCECCEHRIPSDAVKYGVMVEGCQRHVTDPQKCHKWLD